MKRKTRFERVAPPPPKERKTRTPTRRNPEMPNDWEQRARFYSWFPFITEKTWEEKQEFTPREEILPGEEDKPPPPKKYRSKRIEKYHMHETLKVVMQNALHQAYVSGYVEVVRAIEDVLPFLIVRHSRSRKLQAEVREYLKTLKKNLAEGRTRGP